MAARVARQEPRDEQQRVTGQEEADEQTRLSEDDDRENEQSSVREKGFDVHESEHSSNASGAGRRSPDNEKGPGANARAFSVEVINRWLRSGATCG